MAVVWFSVSFWCLLSLEYLPGIGWYLMRQYECWFIIPCPLGVVLARRKLSCCFNLHLRCYILSLSNAYHHVPVSWPLGVAVVDNAHRSCCCIPYICSPTTWLTNLPVQGLVWKHTWLQQTPVLSSGAGVWSLPGAVDAGGGSVRWATVRIKALQLLATALQLYPKLNLSSV